MNNNIWVNRTFRVNLLSSGSIVTLINRPALATSLMSIPSPGTACSSPEVKTYVQSMSSPLTFTLILTVTGSSHLEKNIHIFSSEICGKWSWDVGPKYTELLLETRLIPVERLRSEALKSCYNWSGGWVACERRPISGCRLSPPAKGWVTLFLNTHRTCLLSLLKWFFSRQSPLCTCSQDSHQLCYSLQGDPSICIRHFPPNHSRSSRRVHLSSW